MIDEVIDDQIRLFHTIEDLISSDVERDYGTNYPIMYDIIIAIYHEVNASERDKTDIEKNAERIYKTKIKL